MKNIFIINIIFIILVIVIIFFILNRILFIKKINEKFTNNKSAVFYFCQGWTDIFNHLSLINYYSDKYDKLYVIVRSNGKEIVNFFTKNLDNIIILEFDENIYCNGSLCDDNKIIEYNLSANNDIMKNSHHLFHGWADKNINDNYNNNYNGKFSNLMNINHNNFVNLFYETYDLDKNIRINNFIFIRDIEMENNKYNEFIELNGKDYILYHEEYKNINNLEYPFINLNQTTYVYFDYIKILENSKEIHLLDSSWAAFIYLLDAKYGLFKNINIYLYPKRGYILMFQDPVKLENWIFITD